MPLVTRTGQVSFAPKGDKGDKGARMRMRVWGASVSYLEGKQGQQFYDIVLYDNLLYLCIRSHTSVSTDPPKQNVASGKIKYWEVAQSWTFIATKLLLTEKIKASMIDADGIRAVNVDISGKITADEGNIGGFAIDSASLEATSGFDSMLLTAGLIRFMGEYSKVFIGAETMPSSNGGSFSTPVRIEVNRNINSTLYGNAGLFVSVEGSHAYDDDRLQFTGNHALYIPKGDVCGFRLRLRRINANATLTEMDSVVLAIKAGITLRLPTTAEDGQFYWIRNTSNGNVYVVGTNLVGWESGELSTSMYLMPSSATAIYYDKYNNRWFMNWIGFWT